MHSRTWLNLLKRPIPQTDRVGVRFPRLPDLLDKKGQRLVLFHHAPRNRSDDDRPGDVHSYDLSDRHPGGADWFDGSPAGVPAAGGRRAGLLHHYLRSRHSQHHAADFAGAVPAVGAEGYAPAGPAFAVLR